MPDFSSSEYVDLINGLDKGMCLFLGAGVSKLAGYKLWDELGKEMTKRFWNKKRIEYSDMDALNKLSHNEPITVMDFLYSKDQTLFEIILKEIFEEDNRNEDNRIYKSLRNFARIENTVFIQTNIDKGLQTNLGITDSDIQINPHLSFPPKLLNYLHGRIDKTNSWVFTTKQCDRNYLDDKNSIMKFLTEILETYNVLFIGYGLRDIEIQIALRKARLNGRIRKHYLLEDFHMNKATYIRIRATNLKVNFNIQLIPYVIESKGFEVLVNVINQLFNVLSYERIRSSDDV